MISTIKKHVADSLFGREQEFDNVVEPPLSRYADFHKL